MNTILAFIECYKGKRIIRFYFIFYLQKSFFAVIIDKNSLERMIFQCKVG